MHAHERRTIGRRRDDHRAPPRLGRQILRDEILHFSAALADQPDDDHVGVREPRHHAEQHALADAAAGEETQPLAAADGQQRVDRAHADVERLAYRPAVERVRSCAA